MSRKNEAHDDYAKVITTLNDDWRIIEDRAGIQWKFQKRYKTAWISKSFCRTKEGLLAVMKRYAPSLVDCINASAYRAVSTLPERL